MDTITKKQPAACRLLFAAFQKKIYSSGYLWFVWMSMLAFNICSTKRILKAIASLNIPVTASNWFAYTKVAGGTQEQSSSSRRHMIRAWSRVDLGNRSRHQIPCWSSFPNDFPGGRKCVDCERNLLFEIKNCLWKTGNTFFLFLPDSQSFLEKKNN